MPLLTIELMEGHGPEVYRELIERGTALYAEVLDAPIGRFRTVIRPVAADCWGLGGEQGSSRVSPLIIFEMMESRPRELHLRLMREMSALVASILDIDVSVTRVLLREFPATHWAIGGEPASVVRSDEVAAREAAAAPR